MKINWNISQTDIEIVKKVIADNKNSFLQARQLRNVEKQNIVIDKDRVIKVMIMCLLTSQQRSGPNSAVGQFLTLDPFPITIEKLTTTDNVKDFIKATLQQHGLNRFINNVSFFFDSIYRKIEEKKMDINQ
jgi:hypothetical protein